MEIRLLGFDDPPNLSAGAEAEEQALAHYRLVRDEIKTFAEQLPERLTR
jgi:arsenate reductase (thioredoxin)